MTLKEFNKETLSNYFKIVSEKTRSNLDIEDLKNLNISMVNICSSLSNLISFEESIMSMVVHLGESDSIEINDGIEKDLENGFVYIAKQTNENNLYKIGMTKDLSKRERAFKTGNIYIKIIASMRHSKYKKLEKWIHAELSKYRVDGEWFLIEKPLLMTMITKLGFSVHVS